MGLMSGYGVTGEITTILVANATLLATVPDLALPDKTRARVGVIYDDVDLDKSSVLTVDNKTVFATLSGTGRWIRRQIPNPRHWKQTSWQIDPITGNDLLNSGAPGSPLATAAELDRRWGENARLVNGVILEILSDLPDSDPLRLNIQMPPGPAGGAQTRFCLKGSRALMASDVLTGYTPLSRVTGATSRNVITSALDFTPYLGYTVVLTSGAGSGYSAQIQAAGVGVATITPWVQEFTSDTLSPTGTPLLQPAGIVAGDAFEIRKTPSIGSAPVLIFTQGGAYNGTNNASSVIQIKNIRNTQNPAGATNIPTGSIESYGSGTIIYTIGCKLAINWGVGLNRIQNCLIGGGVISGVGPIGNSPRFTAGGQFSGAPGINISSSASVLFDGDFAFLAPITIGGSTVLGASACQFGNVGFFVTAASDAITVNSSGILLINGGFYGSNIVYGTGPAYGIRVYSSGKILYTTKPTVNDTLGVGRETIIAGVDTLYAAVPAIDAATTALIAVYA